MSKPSGQGPRPTNDWRESLAAAYDAHAARLYQYALVLLADHTMAEDAVHQAFMKLARMGRRLEDLESCRDYLRVAVRNECWRMLKWRQRAARQMATASADPLLQAADSALSGDDERIRIEAALRALPAEQREVVYLKVYEGNTFQEIAGQLAISINTAASRYRYAIEKLRRHLGSEGVSDER